MAEMKVSRLKSKSHDKPDEVRSPDKTRVEVVRLKDFTIRRMTFQPGWLAMVGMHQAGRPH